MNTSPAPKTTKATTRSAKRSLARAVIVAGAVTSALLLGGPTAHAGVKEDCAKAGGTYKKIGTTENCCFGKAIDSAGNTCKVYIAGEWVGNSHRELPPSPPPPTKPSGPAQMPDTGGVGPGAPKPTPVAPLPVPPKF